MRSVLIVDDNADLLDVLSEVLLSEGLYSVHLARTGAEALALYAAVDPALVILDEGLSDMAGSELLRRLRTANAHASRPALFVTGALRSVSCLPGDVVLEKPVDLRRLLTAVAALLPQA